MPKILRLRRMGIAPQPGLGFHCRAFGGSVRLSIGRTLLILILFVVPRHAALNLVKVYGLSARQEDDFANESAVSTDSSVASG